MPSDWQNRGVSSADPPEPADHAPGLAVAAVARRLGVAPATLRTWDRRYGLGPSQHEAGAHRRYTAQDVGRLLVMRRLTVDGLAPSDAARVALGAPPDESARLLGADRSPQAVVDAALAADADRLAALLRLGDEEDAVAWWTGLVAPARDQLRLRTVLDRPGQDAVLSLQQAVVEAVRRLTAERHRHPAGGVVLLQAPPGAPRPLVLHAVAAAVPQVDARLVSGPVIGRHLVELAAMTRARAVVTVCERVGDDLSLVGELAAERPDLPQLVMVPPEDFGRVPLGPAVQRARSAAGWRFRRTRCAAWA
ncbi:MAG: MerR family transcriptional regulator [Actinobacteria bacterium]|nr:MerR family transcriptional regulator [Actinomycetota bacterium]